MLWGTSVLRDICLIFMKPLLKAERYTHGVRLTEYNRDMQDKLFGYLESLKLKEPKKLPGNRIIMELKKKYFGMTEDGKEIYIHRNCYDDMVGYLANKGIPPSCIEVVDIPVPNGDAVKLELLPQYVLRDYQEIIKSDILRPHLHSARIDLYTGYGKTLTSLAAAVDFGERVLVMVPPKYFGIWSEALEKTYKGIEKRWVTVSGSAELQKLIDRGIEKDLEDIDVIIMSSISYRSYIENFEKYGEKIDGLGYNVPPPRFHEACGIGLQINDEIQEDPGLLFRIDIFSNVKKQIYLSATPFTGNAFVTKMIDKQLPESTQCRLPNYEVFINCLGLLYTEPKIRPQDYLTPFKNTYNHARYETVMMKNVKRKMDYFKMVAKIADGVFTKTRLPGQKLLILCATVAFIDDLVVYLEEKYPDLQVNGHTSGSPYERLLKNDITVSTIKSSGTGVDIPDLRELILLQATGSKKDAIQILGRLRKLKSFPDVTPKLTIMCCTSIPQHNRYLEMHRENFAGRTLNFKIMTVGM